MKLIEMMLLATPTKSLKIVYLLDKENKFLSLQEITKLQKGNPYYTKKYLQVLCDYEILTRKLSYAIVGRHKAKREVIKYKINKDSKIVNKLFEEIG